VSEPHRQENGPGGAATRLDSWLDIACLFKTRSEAQKACRGGKVDVNGQAARPNRLLRKDDLIRITRGDGRRQMVCVLGFATRHVPKVEARRLYEDRTPPPTPEERERRRLARLFGVRAPTGSPDRRARRAVRRMKRGG
jgi:ribosome-associated heat shock protein Hsp15